MNTKFIDPEIQAYLYQQLNRLQPYIKEEGQLSFHQDVKDESGDEQKMRLMYSTSSFNLESEGSGSDIYEASQNATESMIDALAEMDGEDDEPLSRENMIDMLQKNPYLH